MRPSEEQERSHHQTCGTSHWREIWSCFVIKVLSMERNWWEMFQMGWQCQLDIGHFDIKKKWEPWYDSLSWASVNCPGWKTPYLRYMSKMAGKFSGFLKRVLVNRESMTNWHIYEHIMYIAPVKEVLRRLPRKVLLTVLKWNCSNSRVFIMNQHLQSCKDQIVKQL